jgi:hypothetical protein
MVMQPVCDCMSRARVGTPTKIAPEDVEMIPKVIELNLGSMDP